MPSKLGLAAVNYRIIIAPRHDGEARTRAHELLRPFVRTARYALVVFDREGCGSNSHREELENQTLAKLTENGWDGRASVVVIDPELEVWVWSGSPKVDATLGWSGRRTPLRDELKKRGFLASGKFKPQQPKSAMLWALREARKPRSSSLFKELAGEVSWERCSDPAFLKLKSTLETWFTANVG